MGGHQEGYVRPSDGSCRPPGALCRQAADRGQGRRAPHLGLRPLQDHAQRLRVQARLQGAHRQGEGRDGRPRRRRPRERMVEAIVGGDQDGGLFAVDVDIIPTKIGAGLPRLAAGGDSGEMNLTSMNGERRMRLTERYMDPPGPAMPDCLIAARHRQHHGDGAAREKGDADYADKFKGFDWKTEEDAFMDGYQPGDRRRVRHLRAPARHGHQRLPGAGDRLRGRQDRRHQAPLRRRQVRPAGRDGKASSHGDAWRGLQAPGKQAAEGQLPVPDQQRPRQHRLAERPISTRRTTSSWTAGRYPYIEMNPDDMTELGRQARATSSRSTTTTAPPRRWSIRRRRAAEGDLHAVRRSRPACRATSINAGVNEFIIPNYKQTWGEHPQDRRRARVGEKAIVQIVGLCWLNQWSKIVSIPGRHPSPWVHRRRTHSLNVKVGP